MTFSFSSSKLLPIACLGLAMAFCIVPAYAQQQSETAQAPAKQTQYTFRDLGTLGGGFSQAFFVNKFGAAGGISSVSNGDQHAFLWRNGSLRDLGTLGGHNSVDFGSPNPFGQLAGESETSTSDPKGEDFCGFGTHQVCLAYVWEPSSPQSGVMEPLPNLKGGTNSQAAWLNDRGEIVGSSENGVADSTCPGPSIAPQLTEFKPVIWYKPFSWFKAQIMQLPTPSGDPDGVALSANEEGDAVGSTGSCGVFNLNQFTNLSQVLPSHAVLWKNGRVIDLKGNGGLYGNTAFSINDFDQVVGVSDLPGDANFHAFLWENGRVTDLKPYSDAVSSDANSVGLGINNHGQIVGLSLDQDFDLRPMLWDAKGYATDLGSLATSDSTIIPFVAEWINGKGEIAGWGLEPNSGEIHGFLASPSCGIAETDLTKGDAKERPRVQLSESAQQEILLHLKLGKSIFSGGGRAFVPARRP